VYAIDLFSSPQGVRSVFISFFLSPIRPDPVRLFFFYVNPSFRVDLPPLGLGESFFFFFWTDGYGTQIF